LGPNGDLITSQLCCLPRVEEKEKENHHTRTELCKTINIKKSIWHKISRISERAALEDSAGKTRNVSSVDHNIYEAKSHHSVKLFNRLPDFTMRLVEVCVFEPLTCITQDQHVLKTITSTIAANTLTLNSDYNSKFVTF